MIQSSELCRNCRFHTHNHINFMLDYFQTMLITPRKVKRETMRNINCIGAISLNPEIEASYKGNEPSSAVRRWGWLGIHARNKRSVWSHRVFSIMPLVIRPFWIISFCSRVCTCGHECVVGDVLHKKASNWLTLADCCQSNLQYHCEPLVLFCLTEQFINIFPFKSKSQLKLRTEGQFEWEWVYSSLRSPR